MNAPNASPLITVYVACRNYGRYVAEAIESVLRQHCDDWELLLVDNGSTDDSLATMRLYENDPRVRIFPLTTTTVPIAANLAIREARGKYLMRLDADDVLDESALLVLSNYLERHPEAALVFPDYFLIDSFGNVFATERRQTVYQQNHMLDLPPNGACTMIRLDVLREIGGYREDLHAQDGLDIWTRIRERHRSGNINVPLFYYRRHGDNMTGDSARIFAARRQIKRDAVDFAAYRPIVAVIPCRRCYDFQLNLWSAPFGSGTLLDRAITTCLASPLFDRIAVASDTDEVEAVLPKYADPRLCYVPRTTASTLATQPIAETLAQVKEGLQLGGDGVFVLTYLQAPFTTTETVEEAVSTLAMNGAHSSIAVDEVKLPLYRRSAFGLTSLNNNGRVSSDFDRVYAEVRTCMATRLRNLRSGTSTGSRIVHFEIPEGESLFIKSPRDLEIARLIAQPQSPAP